MSWTHLATFRVGWQSIEPMLPLVMGSISLGILLGCAVASWLCPSRNEDCLFRRHVM